MLCLGQLIFVQQREFEFVQQFKFGSLLQAEAQVLPAQAEVLCTEAEVLCTEAEVLRAGPSWLRSWSSWPRTCQREAGSPVCEAKLPRSS